MIVYGDLFFLINFSMDFLCFYICCRLRGQRLRTGRGVIAAALGGMYSVVSLFITADRWVALLLDMLVLVLMCLCVCGEKRMGPIRFLRFCILFFIVSSLLGGVMTALFSLFNRMKLHFAEMGAEDGVDVWIFGTLALISALFTLVGGRSLRASANKGRAVLELEGMNGKKAVLSALIDSGNGSIEPISGKSVVFADLNSIRELIDPELFSVLAMNESVERLPANLTLGVRLVPVRTVSGSALLPAFKVKRVYIIMNKRKKELDVYIAPLSKGELKENDAIISHEATI